jgi:methionyl-tRNA formyltransferase
VKIIFAGTPEISAAVLSELLTAKHNIIACLTQPDRPQGRGLKLTASAVKTVALQHGIPVLQPASLKSAAVQQELRALQPDLMIVLAYGLILPPAVLEIPQRGCINIHASILPRWRGAAPIQHAILSGDTETGITIMQMDAGLDTGDILATYPCAINISDTSDDLYQRLTNLAATAILDSIIKLQAHKLIPTKQNPALATYAHKIQKSDAQINWQQSATQIDRMIRAYNPWPVACTILGDQTIRVWRAENAPSKQYNAAPGTIMAIDKNSIEVSTGDGVLRLLNLQLPGKKVLPIADICHAHPEFKIGAQFI